MEKKNVCKLHLLVTKPSGSSRQSHRMTSWNATPASWAAASVTPVGENRSRCWLALQKFSPALSSVKILSVSSTTAVLLKRSCSEGVRQLPSFSLRLQLASRTPSPLVLSPPRSANSALAVCVWQNTHTHTCPLQS